MRLVVADTGPINYLVLIGHIDVLPTLFQVVTLPTIVQDELTAGPSAVRSWIANPPGWIDIRRGTHTHCPSMKNLHRGEREAIALAVQLHADLLLMDDREGVAAAHRSGIAATGTLGVLARAAKRSLLDLPTAFDRLKQTNFRYRQDTMNLLLNEVIGNG